MIEYTPPQSHYEWTSEQIKGQAFSYMEQLEGWCSNDKASVLIDLILKDAPGIIVEIGVFGGKSLIPMAVAARANRSGGIAYGIDPWDPDRSIEEVMNEDNQTWWQTLDYEKILRHLVRKIDEFGLQNHVVLLRTTSEGAPPIQGIGLLHVDGNHSDKTSYFDVTKWVPLVKKGGWVVFDDMTWFENGEYTTAKAVQWLDQHCARFAHFKDSAGEWGVWVKL